MVCRIVRMLAQCRMPIKLLRLAFEVAALWALAKSIWAMDDRTFKAC